MGFANVRAGTWRPAAQSASRSLRRVLLTPQVKTGSRYRCGKSTEEQPVGYARRKGGLKSASKTRFSLAGLEEFSTMVHELHASASEKAKARPSLIPSLCTHFIRAGIEWRR